MMKLSFNRWTEIEITNDKLVGVAYVLTERDSLDRRNAVALSYIIATMRKAAGLMNSDPAAATETILELFETEGKQ